MEIPGGLKVISVVNNKGGVGKTTVTKALAEYTAQIEGYRTLLLDMDAQCSLSNRYLAMEQARDAAGSFAPPIHPEFRSDDPDMDGWSGRSSTSDLYYDMKYGIYPYPTGYERLEILPAHGSTLRAVDLQRREDIEALIVSRLRQFLWTEEVAEQYDVVIIDTAPAKSPVTQSTFRAGTHIVIPTMLDSLGMEGIYGMLRYYQDERMRRGASDTPLELVGILPNQVRPRTRQAKEVLRDLRNPELGLSKYLLNSQLGLRTALTVVNAREEEPESVFQLPPSDPAHQEAYAACEEIWDRILGREGSKHA